MFSPSISPLVNWPRSRWPVPVGCGLPVPICLEGVDCLYKAFLEVVCRPYRFLRCDLLHFCLSCFAWPVALVRYLVPPLVRYSSQGSHFGVWGYDTRIASALVQRARRDSWAEFLDMHISVVILKRPLFRECARLLVY
jgi:hypothetical protein